MKRLQTFFFSNERGQTEVVMLRRVLMLRRSEMIVLTLCFMIYSGWPGAMTTRRRHHRGRFTSSLHLQLPLCKWWCITNTTPYKQHLSSVFLILKLDLWSVKMAVHAPSSPHLVTEKECCGCGYIRVWSSNTFLIVGMKHKAILQTVLIKKLLI